MAGRKGSCLQGNWAFGWNSAFLSGNSNISVWRIFLQTATTVPAPVYIALLFDWVDELIEDDTVFPKTDDQQFPQDFVKKYATKMFTRLFRVFTHIYYSHFGDLETLSAVPHADTFLLQVQLGARFDRDD